jgi:hypothetical protein
MAVTVSNVSASSVTTGGRNDVQLGERRAVLHRVTFDASYPTGGQPYDPRSFGVNFPVATIFLNVRKVAASVGTEFVYDYVNKKIFAFVTSTGLEVANAVNLSTVVIDAFVVGE